MMAWSGQDHEVSEDEDVVWDGSPLHEHMKEIGLDCNGAVQRSRQVQRKPEKPKTWKKKTAKDRILEVKVAEQLIQSDLLVQEDQDFVGNFVLTDEALEQHRDALQEMESQQLKGALADALLFFYIILY